MLRSVLVFFLISFSLAEFSFASGPGLTFIQNKGQWEESIQFLADVPGGKIILKKDRIVVLRYNDHEHGHGLLHHDQSDMEADDFLQRLNPESIEGHRYDMIFKDASEDVGFEGRSDVSTSYNYFIGKNPDRWASNVQGFSKVYISEVYPGIDIEFYSMGYTFKYDFHVKPGADISKIKLKYEGLDELILSESKLQLKTSFDDLLEEIPFAFAEDMEGNRVVVQFEYELEDDIVSFVPKDNYNSDHKLVIDPILIFSTYSGSEADNWGNTATFDDAGNLYSGGITNHVRNSNFVGEFPATPGAFQEEYGGVWDVALAKYDSTGSNLEFATYLGGSGSESPQSLIVNNNGDLVILGVTGSTDFPITEDAFQRENNGGPSASIINGVPVDQGSDLFIAILSPDGSTLKASTYFGGTNNEGILDSFSDINKNYGDESRGDVIIDKNDNVYISSRSYSEGLPFSGYQSTKNNSIDGIILKFNPDLSNLIWGTYLGGNGDDVSLSIKLFEDKIYLAGGTNSIDFPTNPNALYAQPTGNIDGWIAALNADGDSLVYSTYIGTTDYDQVYQMDIDLDGNIYVVGQTRGPFPISDGVYSVPNSGQFMAKLDNALTTSIWSTLFGAGDGEPDISITAFLVNDCNNIYVSGWGSNTLIQSFLNAGFPYVSLNTTGLPTTFDAAQSTTAGSDFYLAVFTDDASELLYGTFFGGSSSTVHVDGGTSRFDKQGIVYHSVCASCAENDSSFPTTDGAWAEENGSVGCNNAVFKFDLASIDARFITNTEELDAPGTVTGCAPFRFAFENRSVGGQIFEWDFGDGFDTTTMVRDTVFHTFNIPGKFTVRLRIFDQTTCKEEDFTFRTVEVFGTNFNVSNDVSICGGTSVNLSAFGGTTYEWSPSTGLSNTNSGNVIASPDTTTVYKVRIVNENGCEEMDSVLVNVVPEIIPAFQVQQLDKCEGIPTIEATNLSENFEEIIWTLGGTELFSTDSLAQTQFNEGGEVTLRAELRNRQCSKIWEETLVLEPLFVPNVFTPNGDGRNDFFEIQSSLPVDLTVVNRYGKVVFTAENYQNTWNGGDLASGVYYYDVVYEDGETCNGWVQILR